MGINLMAEIVLPASAGMNLHDTLQYSIPSITGMNLIVGMKSHEDETDIF
jgi:hypothetical protein